MVKSGFTPSSGWLQSWCTYPLHCPPCLETLEGPSDSSSSTTVPLPGWSCPHCTTGDSQIHTPSLILSPKQFLFRFSGALEPSDLMTCSCPDSNILSSWYPSHICSLQVCVPRLDQVSFGSPTVPHSILPHFCHSTCEVFPQTDCSWPFDTRLLLIILQ